MASEVKLTIKATDYQTLQAMLKYLAGQITKEQFIAILISLGYTGYNVSNFDRQMTFLAEQMVIAIS
jgi:hypothetical protein